MERPNGIQTNVQLAAHTTLQIGGAAEYFFEAPSEALLRSALLWAKEQNIPVTVLGGGSNVLIADEGLRGLVVKQGIQGVSYSEEGESVYVTAGAGEEFDALVADLTERNIWGLENLSHIPGSVGATPIQNVGAYGVEVADRIASVVAYDAHEDTFVVFSNTACRFRYRHSLFKRKENRHYIVTQVTFALSKTPIPRLEYKDLNARFSGRAEPALQEIRDAVIETRSRKFPDWRKVGTAGSFFKNPIIPESHYTELLKTYPKMPGFPVQAGKVKVPLGWILEHVLNMKGVQEGNVGTYEGQALVLINHGGATAEEMHAFAEGIERKVKDATGIDIEWEVTKID